MPSSPVTMSITQACCECFLKNARQYSTTVRSNDADQRSDSKMILKSEQSAPLTRKEKLKKAVKEYGSTVIIFHVGISLVSLGVCYSLISR